MADSYELTVTELRTLMEFRGKEGIEKVQKLGGTETITKKLKEKEDKWICRMGTLHKPHGLNSRDEIKSKSRCTY